MPTNRTSQRTTPATTRLAVPRPVSASAAGSTAMSPTATIMNTVAPTVRAIANNRRFTQPRVSSSSYAILIASTRCPMPLDAAHNAATMPITTPIPAAVPAFSVIEVSCAATSSRTSWARSQASRRLDARYRKDRRGARRGKRSPPWRARLRATSRRPPRPTARARGLASPPPWCESTRPSNLAAVFPSAHRRCAHAGLHVRMTDSSFQWPTNPTSHTRCTGLPPHEFVKPPGEVRMNSRERVGDLDGVTAPLRCAT